MTTMPLRHLGRSDLLVSAVGLGCNNFGRPGAATEEQAGTSRVLHAAIDHGITLLDTAEMYGYSHGRSETLMGAALVGRRDQVVLATKFGHVEAKNPDLPDVPHGSRAYIRASVEGSLRRLRTDYIDLYQLHTPDPQTPVDETLAALHELVDAGYVRYLGHSNFSATQLLEAEAAATAAQHPRFISAQNEYSLIVRDADDDLIPAAERSGVGLLPYFPLHNGLLTGKFTRAGGPADTRIMRQRPHVVDEAPWDALEGYADFCADRGIGMLEATIGWLLSRPAMGSVIAGATSVEQVAQNAAAASAWQPDADELALIDELFPPGAAER
ncbi:MAG: aldo/keto reductase [Microcella sp.]|uniref:aldo/keto reductase n=1 Tax=Microcella sp. TaxID=1913979 RepID=UPI0024C74FBB|nr:aldo/keto reductase [Microcella sp.]UYN83959.1 MAG: aldo/keto reductase [Microcella sp.]